MAIFKKPWTFLILNVVDIVLTIIGLSLHLYEYLYEGNLLFYSMNPQLFFALKIAISLLISTFMAGNVIGEKATIGLNIGIGAVCTWNAIVLIIVGLIYLNAYLF